jgi:hypothetical protein
MNASYWEVIEALNPVPFAADDKPLTHEEVVLSEKLARQIPVTNETRQPASK